MNKRYLTTLSIATLLCVMLLGVTSCKKDDTPDPNKADFFIDAAFLPESETNGEAAPRLVVNFNDEAAMIELRRPSAGTPMESVLLLCPDNEAMMLCGNDSLMVCASYDMETYTPSHDVLIITPMDDDALLLTKGFMNWNTNTLTTGDMMVLPIERSAKSHGRNGDDDIDGFTRKFFFNHFVKPLAESFEQVANYSGIISPFGIVFSYIGATITTNLTVILYSDDPEGLYDATEFSVTNWAGSVIQDGILNFVPDKYSEVASRLLALIDWHADGGHGKVNDYVGGETDGFSYTTFWGQSSNAAESAGHIAIHPPAYNVSLNVSNVTENSAYLKGRFQYTSSMTPVEMGYIFKISGGPEHTQYDMNFQGKTLSGLQKATKYTAFAYVKSAMGDRVLSPGVTFWTLGIEAFPNSLTFPAEGDTKYVGLSYSHEDISSWDITSKPSWCNTAIDDLGLLSVTVGASTEARSGTITITAHSNTLGNVTESIEVTQLGANSWEGTSWKFSGLASGGGESMELECYLTVNNVSNNDVLISFVPDMFVECEEYWGKNYVIDGNGNLVFSATIGDTEVNIGEIRVTFTRTGATTSTADFYGRYLMMKDDWVTITGLLQGTLIRIDEVGNYDTKVKLKTPVFDNVALKNK